MNRFTLPRDLYFGDGALSHLACLKGKKAVLVVGGSSMKRSGFLDKAIGYLQQAGMEVKLIEGITSDPSVECVMEGAAVMRAFAPDWIVSMGGGSAIDAAKGMWIFYEYPELAFQDAVQPFSLPPLRQKAQFAAIPSTSGTATEVTAFSVITDYKTEIKYPLADFNLTPDVAIVDPALVMTLPPQLVAHTGMDALTHAIEAYVSMAHSPFSDPLALHAIAMIQEYLLDSFKGDDTARQQMHYAQCLAGMAFSNALLGITHSMAHKTGAVFHIPHGCANAMYLPFVIAFNKKSCLKRYAAIARHIHLAGDDDEALTEALIRLIQNMNQAMAIPATLAEYGVEAELFNTKVAQISERAIEDACTGSNPRPIAAPEMEKLFRCIYSGTAVDF